MFIWEETQPYTSKVNRVLLFYQSVQDNSVNPKKEEEQIRHHFIFVGSLGKFFEKLILQN